MYYYYISAGKASACNAGDPSSIPGLGNSPGEGKSYPLQYSWDFLVAQKVKTLPAMQKTWVQALGREHPLKEGMATHSVKNQWNSPGKYTGVGSQSLLWAIFQTQGSNPSLPHLFAMK